MPVFLQGRRAFFIIPAPPTSPLQPLISPPRHQFGPRLPAPRLPRCGHLSLLPFLVYPVAATCHSYPHLIYPAAAAACHSYPHFAYFAVAAFGYRGTARTAPSPAWSEMPPRTASLLQFCPEHRHGPHPFSCSTRRRTADPRPCSARGTKKADGTAQRSVRRQKATNLSRQHHRGSSSTRQVSALA